MFDPRVDDGFDASAALPDVEALPAISMVLVASTTSGPPTLPSTRGLVGCSPADGLTGLLTGLNWMAAIDHIAMAAAAGVTLPDDLARFVVGGTRPDDAYPYLDHERHALLGGEDRAPGLLLTTPARPTIVNLSLGARERFAFDPTDPVNHATWVMSASQLCIFAVGNEGARKRSSGSDTTSPWARAPWVLGVGATEDPIGAELASYSSRGLRHDIDSGPDLVAWGRSSFGSRPVGTSFAAPRITRWALVTAQIIHQLAHAADELRGVTPARGVPLVGSGGIDSDFRGHDLLPGPDRAYVPANPIIELASDAFKETLRLLDSEHIPWDVTVTPRRLRRVLFSASRPIPSYGPHEVGAGFLDHDGMYTWWQRFSGALFAWLFAERLPPLPTLEQLQLLALVPLDAVSWAEELHVLTNPQWYWDFAAQQLLEKQVSRVGAMRSPLKVIG